MEKTKAIYFDMDGTIADLYAVENWLALLRSYNPTPYKQAKPLINMQVLARLLNRLQRKGYRIGIISWLSKDSTIDYDYAVTQAKIKWLKKHLTSVNFDEIKIVPYGVSKTQAVTLKGGILFDDELQNRSKWNGTAYDEKNILEKLKNLLKSS